MGISPIWALIGLEILLVVFFLAFFLWQIRRKRPSNFEESNLWSGFWGKKLSHAKPDFQLHLKEDVRLALELFGLKDLPKSNELQSLYRKKIKEVHPDRFAGQGKEVEDLAAKHTQDLNDAFDLLKKEIKKGAA